MAAKPHTVSYSWPWRATARAWGLRLTSLILLTQAACEKDEGSVGAPEHFSTVVIDSSPGPLRLHLTVGDQHPIVRRSDSIIVHYSLVNPGPLAHQVRDRPENYYFRVFAPDGQRLFPRVVSATERSSPSHQLLLPPGTEGPIHAINLACMPYHAGQFEAVFEPGPAPRCEASFAFTTPGTYRIVAQRIPPFRFPGRDRWLTPEDRRAIGEDSLSSHADTLAVEYRPGSFLEQWWRAIKRRL